mgnify:CR=1 FL=1|jgi:hypothetical protein
MTARPQSEGKILASMFSSSIAVANMAMGLRYLTVEEVLEDPAIDLLLIPLKEYEQSYSRVMMGEIRFFVQAFENDFTGVDKIIVNLKRNTLLNRQHSLMQPVVESSELPVEMFWIAELRKPKPSWKDHLTVNLVDSIVKGGLVRDTLHLNLELTVLRALRRTYRGVSLYIHGEPAPHRLHGSGIRNQMNYAYTRLIKIRVIQVGRQKKSIPWVQMDYVW